MNSVIMKIVAIVFAVLGLAFIAGAFLAHLQGVLSQVPVLAAAGVVCLIIAVICFVFIRMRA